MRFQLLSLFIATAFYVELVSAKCEFNDGKYSLRWSRNGNMINFVLIYRDYPQNLDNWLGVAFGQGMMQGLDAILVRNINGKIVVTDDSVFGYGPATTDPDQNVKFEGSKIKNGILQVKFSRPIEVSDKQADLPLSKCTQWQFITVPNPLHGGHTGKHVQTPIGQEVCVEKC